MTVTTAGGTSATSSADRFTYIPAPTVSAVSPSVGPKAGGTSVTVTGTNLADAGVVNFGTTAGTITADTGTSITVTSPAGAGTVERDHHDAWWHLCHLECVRFSYPPDVSGATEQAGGVASSPTGTATAAPPVHLRPLRRAAPGSERSRLPSIRVTRQVAQSRAEPACTTTSSWQQGATSPR